jgi:hypothetical protein
MENRILSEAEGIEYFKKATEKIKKHTIQLFEDDDKYIHFPSGTGVLVNVNDEYMIVTANHVVSECNGDLKILLDDKPIIIDKSSTVSIFDMAYIKIDNSIVNEIKKQYTFLPSNRIIALPENYIDLGLISSGYPSSYQKKRRGYQQLEITSQIVHFDLVISADKEYNKYQIDKKKDILLNYPKKIKFIKTNDLREVANPKGLSGGGLWKVYTDNNFELNCYLVGIMSEFKKTYRNHVFIANRVESLIKLL